jgi:hypothetical protein
MPLKDSIRGMLIIPSLPEFISGLPACDGREGNYNFKGVNFQMELTLD